MRRERFSQMAASRQRTFSLIFWSLFALVATWMLVIIGVMAFGITILYRVLVYFGVL